MLRSIILLHAALAAAPALAANQPAKPVQTVLISFDGAHDNALWKRSLALGEATGAHFTYFLNCVYLLSPENKALFDAPLKGAGKSNVGFAKSRADVSARLMNIWRAHLGGHEIASHTCGHFDGKDWTAADYSSDRKQFRTILANAWTINGEAREPFGWRAFSETFASGFRAPYLSVGPALEQELKAGHYLYDASGTSRDPAEPKVKAGVLRFALPTIPEGPEARRIIAMDYNLFVRHSGGFERADAGGVFERRTLAALYGQFNSQYDGPRHPVQFGLHFVIMNDGVYWRALETFARDVCTRRDVRCTSYEDYAKSTLRAHKSTGPAKQGGT